MPKQFGKSDQTFLPSLPKNRYAALEEVQAFLEANRVQLKGLFDVLCETSDCNLTFNFGDITIEFSRGTPWSESGNFVELSINLKKDGEGRTCEYEYRVEELEPLRKITRLRTEFLER